MEADDISNQELDDIKPLPSPVKCDNLAFVGHGIKISKNGDINKEGDSLILISDHGIGVSEGNNVWSKFETQP